MTLLLNLLVLKTKQLEKLKDFYTNLGLEFIYHKHGDGLLHYSCVLENGFVFEIYPTDQELSDSTRIGFKVNDLKLIREKMQENPIQIIKNTKQELNEVIILLDPDGRKVEISN
jgi:catechol 2,3-dioxygenase-like lactoylglutathione lyase family enzyme